MGAQGVRMQGMKTVLWHRWRSDRFADTGWTRCTTHITIEKVIVAAKPTVAAVFGVDIETQMVVNEDDDLKFEGAAGSGRGTACWSEWQTAWVAGKMLPKRRKVPASVAETFALADELLGTVEAYTFIAECAICLDRGEVAEGGPVNMMVMWERNRKTLLDAQLKKIRKGHARKLVALRDLFKMRKSELLQERDMWHVGQEQLRNEFDKNSFHYLDVSSSDRR